MARTKERPIPSGGEEMPPENMGTPWEVLLEQGEASPAAKPYAFGEKIDEKDRSKNWELCPVCGESKKERHAGDFDYTINYVCRGRGRHEWTLNTRTGIIEEPLQRRLGFKVASPEKE